MHARLYADTNGVHALPISGYLKLSWAQDCDVILALTQQSNLIDKLNNRCVSHVRVTMASITIVTKLYINETAQN